MSKYVIEFSKTGTICYTSHLDLMRIFKRVFKRTGIPLAYSQGFNPHPKMGFAQPLSLGYWGMEEYFECETADVWESGQLLQRLADGMPEGIELKQCLPADDMVKTLSSHTVAAEYMIEIPLQKPAGGASEETGAAGETGAADGAEAAEETEAAEEPGAADVQPQPGDAAVEPDPETDITDPRAMWHSYMGQKEIQVWKRQKKKKEPKLVDIRPMIREITFTPASQTLYVNCVLDGGSASNLSPELIITSVCRRFGISTDRSEVSVMRRKLVFDRPLKQLLG